MMVRRQELETLQVDYTVDVLYGAKYGGTVHVPVHTAPLEVKRTCMTASASLRSISTLS